MTRCFIHGHVGFCGKGSQALCFEHANKNGHRVIFKQHHRHFGHVFLSIETNTALAKYIHALPPRDRTIDEVLWKSVEFFADIDGKKKPKDYEAQFIKKFAKLLKGSFMEEFDPERVRWSDSSRKSKFSKHFSYLGERVWSSSKEQRGFWQRLGDELVDMQCYSRNRCLRTAECYNPSKGYFVMQPEGDWPLESFFVAVDVGDKRPTYDVPKDDETHLKFSNLLRLLKQSRRETRIDCLKVVWALANCRAAYPDCDFERLAHEFASPAGNYCAEWISTNFHKTQPGIGLSSLMFFCKEDARLKDFIPVQLSFRQGIVLSASSIELLNELFSEEPCEWCAYQAKHDIMVTPKNMAFGTMKVRFGRMQTFLNGERYEITAENCEQLTALRTKLNLYDPHQAARMAGCEQTDVDAASYILEELRAAGYMFKCIDARRKTFYFCDRETSIWHRDECGSEIRKWISFDFKQSHLFNFKAYCATQAALTDDPTWTKRPAFWTRACGMVRTIDNVVRVIADLTLDPKFEHFLETKYLQNWDTFAFTNGKLSLNDYQFSDIVPEDYVCLTCGFPWSEELTDPAPLEAILDQIQPKPEVRHFLMRILSTGLEARTLDRTTFFVGAAGANGKSTLTSLMKSALGNYSYTMNTCSVLGYSRSGANPSLANMGLRRFLIVPECESETKGVNTAFLKDITGCTEINARNLYSSKTKTKICPTIVLESNNRPRLQSIDGGVMRRLIQIDFNSRFCVNPQNANEFRLDPMLDARIKKHEFRLSMLKLLIKAHMEYKTAGYDLHVPHCIKQQSLSYIRDNDRLYNAWIDIFQRSAGYTMEGKEVWRTLRDSRWYRANQQRKNFSKKKLFDYLEKSPFLKASFARMGANNGTVMGWRPSDLTAAAFLD